MRAFQKFESEMASFFHPLDPHSCMSFVCVFSCLLFTCDFTEPFKQFSYFIALLLLLSMLLLAVFFVTDLVGTRLLSR